MTHVSSKVLNKVKQAIVDGFPDLEGRVLRSPFALSDQVKMPVCIVTFDQMAFSAGNHSSIRRRDIRGKIALLDKTKVRISDGDNVGERLEDQMLSHLSQLEEILDAQALEDEELQAITINNVRLQQNDETDDFVSFLEVDVTLTCHTRQGNPNEFL